MKNSTDENEAVYKVLIKSFANSHSSESNLDVHIWVVVTFVK